MRGVTSNPTIFASALSKGSAYDEQVADLGVRGVNVDEASRAITSYDIRWACDVLRPVYDETNGLDGRVSIEVDPRLARDTAKTIAEARALWWLVDRPNLFIKIPATEAGLPAITQCLAEGISVNVTLIFSLQRYAEVIDAFMAGLENAAGHDVTHDRVGGVVLRQPGGHRGGQAAGQDRHARGPGAARQGRDRQRAAGLRAVRGEVRRRRGGRALSARGARLQRPLWASTSTKDPAYPDTMYVVDLVAPDTVNTMPEATLHAVADHGQLRGDTIHGTYDESRQVFEQLEAAGISYDDVVTVLENEGVQKFETSWNELLETIKTEMRPRRTPGDQRSAPASYPDSERRGEPA